MSRKETIIGILYGLSIALTCVFACVASVLYLGGLCDFTTFVEGILVSLGYFKFGFKLMDYDTAK